jgi:hypothetical protein
MICKDSNAEQRSHNKKKFKKIKEIKINKQKNLINQNKHSFPQNNYKTTPT